MADSAAPILHHLRRWAIPRALDSADDAELLERFLHNRDDAAFTMLVARHGPMVLATCRRVLHDAHAAEDCFQATFLVLARKAATVRQRHSLAAWLHGVALRVARKARAAAFRREPDAGESLVDPHPDPLASLTARELLTALDEEVQRLPEIYRLPVILCCLEGRTRVEAAKVLGWTLGSVKGRLERGRERLHGRLRWRGLTLSAALSALEGSRCEASAGVPAALLAVTGTAATLFAVGGAVPIGTVSTGAVTLAEGMVKSMTMSRTGIAVVLLLAASVVAGVTGLVSRMTTAAPLRDTRPGARHAALWAAITVNKSVFREGQTYDLQILFTLVNDGKEVVDPRIGVSWLVVNGKELKASATLFGNGPRDTRFATLPAGNHLEFSRAPVPFRVPPAKPDPLGKHFEKPGVYRVVWRGESFESSEIVFRVLPRKEGELMQALADKDGTVRGLLERVVNEGGGPALLLKDVGWVALDEKTEYLAEGIRDAWRIDLKEALGSKVRIDTEQRGNKLFARKVVVVDLVGLSR
jgi:RNA polymerase sigma factor (sigma-70 family)